MDNSILNKPYKFTNTDTEYPATSKAALLRAKIDNGEKLTQEEKVWITEKCTGSVGCRVGIPVMGWIIPFRDVLKLFWYETDFGILKIYSFDKTTLRKSVHHRITRIVDIEKYNEIA